MALATLALVLFGAYDSYPFSGAILTKFSGAILTKFSGAILT